MNINNALFPENPKEDEVHNVRERQNRTALDLVGSLQRPLHRGHQCWQLDTRTGEITPAQYEASDVDFNTDPLAPRRLALVMKEHCAYATALNEDNARRRFEKMLH